MSRFYKKRDENRGMAPGSLVFIGEQKMDYSRIRLIDYDSFNLIENEIKDINETGKFIKSKTVSWINIDGIHNSDLISETGTLFNLHPLLQEDLLNTGQRPKLEEHDNCLFVVLKMISYDSEAQIINSEQLSMVLGKKYLLTFQERVGDVFEPVRERIRKKKGRIRDYGNDYLAYALLDTIIDNYIYTIEKIGSEIEDIEEEILSNPDKNTVEKINNMKREMNFLRKTVRPVKDAVMFMTKLDSDFIHERTEPFLKDLLDIATQAVEVIDTYRDILSDQLNIYNSTINHKMNDIMKILTMFAAIFIPMTFIAGVYGTNFKYLPELEFRYSYFIFWGILVIIALIMFSLFKRKKWL